MLSDRLNSEELPHINMTPMVDVVLCLLIFFMIATRMEDWDQEQFHVKVPEVASARLWPRRLMTWSYRCWRRGRCCGMAARSDWPT